MGLTRYKLGNLIEPVYETNSDLVLGPESVMGMTITKELIPTKAKLNGTDLSKFVKVEPGTFVFNPRTHGKKIGFGFNDSCETYLISWNNNAFVLADQAKDIIHPKYLFFHFNRDEWDREACYRSWGSSTEVFTWDALFEMEIDLPPIEIQQKYVDIYNAMVANQKCYEDSLEDIKLTCDAELEHLMRQEKHCRIGEFIELIDERNQDEALGQKAVRGISTEKQLISTKAKLDGVNLNSYKVVLPGKLAYVADTSRRGDKISIAYNSGATHCLVSSITTVFGCRDGLLPEYLMLFFTRPEFDRYARFHSWGSAREVFSWDDMQDVKIPIPDIKTQQSLANLFTVYNQRKEINERMKTHIKDICPILIKGSLEEAVRS